MSRSWKKQHAKRPAGKRLRKAQRSAAADEKDGYEAYEALAKKEMAIGHVGHANQFLHQAGDERGHRKNDLKIAREDRLR